MLLETSCTCWPYKDILGKQRIDPKLQDLVVIPEGFAPQIFHVGSVHDLHSIITSGLIAGGKEGKQGSQTVFLTAVVLMEEDNLKSSALSGVPITGEEHSDDENCDKSRPRVQESLESAPDALYWTHLATAQKQGLV